MHDYSMQLIAPEFDEDAELIMLYVIIIIILN